MCVLTRNTELQTSYLQQIACHLLIRLSNVTQYVCADGHEKYFHLESYCM